MTTSLRNCWRKSKREPRARTRPLPGRRRSRAAPARRPSWRRRCSTCVERASCGSRGGEADLVVDHDVHACRRSSKPRACDMLQQFHDDALAGERGVAVDQHRHHLLCAASSPRRVLARAHRAVDHRVDDLQMRRIERQRHVHGAALGVLTSARETHVVLHVAGVRRVVRMLELAFELGEQLLRRLAERC